ncbi:MAG: hypothetical protein ABF296_12730 [Oceanococcaceae bacterium]
MKAWEVAKGVLIAVAILTVVGWLLTAAMCAGGAAMMGATIEHVNEETKRIAVQRQAEKTKRDQLERQRRLNTPRGKSLNRQCQDWKRAQADYDFPSTREGVAKYCGELEQFLTIAR